MQHASYFDVVPSTTLLNVPFPYFQPTIAHKTNELRETREARDREAREREGEALFARSGVREAALLLVREKAGRYTLQREPLFLDRCVVAADHEPEHFFEVHEITTKDSFIFKVKKALYCVIVTAMKFTSSSASQTAKLDPSAVCIFTTDFIQHPSCFLKNL